MKPMLYVLQILVCIFAATAARETASAAESLSPVMGGSGGTSYNLDCGAKAVLIAVKPRTSSFVDRIQAVCQRIKADGTLGDTFRTGSAGGTGGTEKDLSLCSRGKVVGGIQARTGMFVDSFTLLCFPWDPHSRTTSFVAPESQAVGFGSGGSAVGPYYCPDGKPAKALRGKAGFYIDSIRLVCDDWDK